MTNVHYLHHAKKTPKRRHEYSYYRVSPGKLERRAKYDTGKAYALFNIDTSDYPVLKSAGTGKLLREACLGTVLDFLVSDGMIYILRKYAGELYLTEFDPASKSSVEHSLGSDPGTDPKDYQLVRFNEFSSWGDPLGGKTVKKILVLPGYRTGEIGTGKSTGFETPEAFPSACVGTEYNSRIFCACNGKIFASDFNDATSYNFDTALDQSDSNAWMSNTQSNSKADGEITALAVYDGHVVIFKRDYMMQVHNNKNPFRIVEIGSWGCVSKRSLCEFDGKLAFVSPEGVMLYAGGYPYKIGDELGVSSWEGACLCARGKLLYVHVPSELTVYVYDAERDCWGNRDIRGLSFMGADHSGAYYVLGNAVYAFDEGTPGQFSIETDRNSLGYDGKKRICGICIEALIGDGGELCATMLDQDYNQTDIVHIDVPGEHFINKRINGAGVNYFQLELTGSGEVSIGGITVKYKREDDA